MEVREFSRAVVVPKLKCEWLVVDYEGEILTAVRTQELADRFDNSEGPVSVDQLEQLLGPIPARFREYSHAVLAKRSHALLLVPEMKCEWAFVDYEGETWPAVRNQEFADRIGSIEGTVSVDQINPVFGPVPVDDVRECSRALVAPEMESEWAVVHYEDEIFAVVRTQELADRFDNSEGPVSVDQLEQLLGPIPVGDVRLVPPDMQVFAAVRKQVMADWIGSSEGPTSVDQPEQLLS